MSTSVGKKAEDKTSAPTAVLEQAKVRRVRNREPYPQDGSITGTNTVEVEGPDGAKKVIERPFFERYFLPSNVWTEVTENVYQHLKSKFGEARVRVVLDHRQNEMAPHDYGETKYKQEPKPMPVIEGLGDE